MNMSNGWRGPSVSPWLSTWDETLKINADPDVKHVLVVGDAVTERLCSGIELGPKVQVTQLRTGLSFTDRLFMDQLRDVLRRWKYNVVVVTEGRKVWEYPDDAFRNVVSANCSAGSATTRHKQKSCGSIRFRRSSRGQIIQRTANASQRATGLSQR